MNVIFSKYNSKGSSTGGSISSSTGGSSSSNSSEFEQVTTSGINRILWGNSDDGDDLNESMWVNGNIHIGEWNIEYEEDEDGELDEELPILPKEEEDAGTGNIYATGKIEGDSTYGKTVYLDYPERKTDDSNKTDLLELLKKFDNAKIWGQGLKANNYNITGNMSSVGDINFSGSSKVVGSMTNANLRPNNIYTNSNVVVSSYNGNPWDYALMKYTGAASFLNNNSLQLHSVVDYYNDGNYYNNPRILWNIYNPKTVLREGHWWLGPNWHNGDINRYGTDGHKNFALYPSFEVPDDMKGDDGNPKAEFFKQFNFNINSNVTAMSFIKHNGKSSEFLMADGSVKELDMSGFVSGGDLTDYAKKSDVPKKVSQLENDVPYAEYSKSNPVILFSGVIAANNQDSSSTNYQPWARVINRYSQHNSVMNMTMDYYEVAGEKKPSLVIKLIAREGYTVTPTSVNSTVITTTQWDPKSDFGGNRRSQGYWTTGGVQYDGSIMIQVWRTHDDNNDSTTNDAIAWQVREMNVTIYGLGYKN